jgi:hypothetical protein
MTVTGNYSKEIQEAVGKCLIQGITKTAEIAEVTGIPYHTVKNCLTQMYSERGFHEGREVVDTKKTKVENATHFGTS